MSMLDELRIKAYRVKVVLSLGALLVLVSSPLVLSFWQREDRKIWAYTILLGLFFFIVTLYFRAAFSVKCPKCKGLLLKVFGFFSEKHVKRCPFCKQSFEKEVVSGRRER